MAIDDAEIATLEAVDARVYADSLAQIENDCANTLCPTSHIV